MYYKSLKTDTRLCGVVHAIIATSMLVSTPLLQKVHADAYLDALQDEAEELSVDPETAANKSAGETARSGDLSQTAFEKMLDKQFHGTFIFYSRLTEKNRLLAYQAYIKNPDIDLLRKTIMDLLVNNK